MATSIRRISAQNLKPGMILANAIIADNRSVLATEKTRLTQSVIERILSSGTRYVDIMISTDPEVSAGKRPEEQPLFEKHVRMAQVVKEGFERIRLTHALPHEEFVNLSNEIATTMINTPGVLHSLQMVRAVDNYTYTHSVNVGVLAGLIGKWTGYHNIPELILAGLLHDVGKTQIPLEILNKPSRLDESEMSLMRLHSTLGYELALGSGNISESAMLGILHHHERLDGTGYPNGLRDVQVPYVPKILAVADVFDAMTSNRVYRCALSPFDVLEEIFGEMFSALDPAICYVFRQRIKELLVGSKVVLSDGRKARIVFVDGGDHFRPVLQDESGQSFSPAAANLQIIKFVDG